MELQIQVNSKVGINKILKAICNWMDISQINHQGLSKQAIQPKNKQIEGFFNYSGVSALPKPL